MSILERENKETSTRAEKSHGVSKSLENLAKLRKESYLVEMLSPADQRRRWFCTFFLILAGGLLLWGLTFLDRALARNPVLFLAYWFTCFVFTGLALVIA